MDFHHLKRLIQGETEYASPVEFLIEVLEASVELVSIPENEFCWSYWADTEEATAELEGLIRLLKAGVLPERISVAVLFAPTGPLQEVSMSSGWANTYLKVAEKYDEVEALLW